MSSEPGKQSKIPLTSKESLNLPLDALNRLEAQLCLLDFNLCVIKTNHCWKPAKTNGDCHSMNSCIGRSFIKHCLFSEGYSTQCLSELSDNLHSLISSEIQEFEIELVEAEKKQPEFYKIKGSITVQGAEQFILLCTENVTKERRYEYHLNKTALLLKLITNFQNKFLGDPSLDKHLPPTLRRLLDFADARMGGVAEINRAGGFHSDSTYIAYSSDGQKLPTTEEHSILQSVEDWIGSNPSATYITTINTNIGNACYRLMISPCRNDIGLIAVVWILQPSSADMDYLSELLNRFTGSCSNIFAYQDLINSEQQAHKKLEENLLEFYKFTNVTPDLVMRISPENKITFVNAAASQLINQSPSQLTGTPLSELKINPESVHLLTKSCDRVRSLRRQVRITLVIDSETTIKHYLDTIIMPENGNQDEETEILAIFRDVTQQKLFEAGALESEMLTDSILNSAMDGIFLLSDRGVIIRANPEAERIFGYENGQLDGKQVTQLMPDSIAKNHQQYIDRFLSTGEKNIIGKSRELTGTKKDHSEFPINLSVSTWELQGRNYFTGVVHDLTESKQLQKQVTQTQMVDAIGRLTGGIAHDFNNVLGVISANLELLQDDAHLSDENKNLTKNAQSAAKKGGDLIKRLLSLTRSQNESKEVFCVNENLEEFWNVLKRALGEKVTLNRNLDAKESNINADKTAFDSTVVNLAVNAKDAMPKGGTITLKTTNLFDEQQNPTHIVISIADDGEGIPDEIVEKVFDPFFTSKVRGKGTGLGLAQVNDFIKASQGTIELETELGVGTEFKLTLPLTKEATYRVEEDNDSLLAEPDNLQQQRILVVDDEQALADLLAKNLRKLKYDVTAVYDPDDAMELLNKEKFHLLITDYLMPGELTGLDLTAKAKTLEPQLPTLIVTGDEKALKENPIYDGSEKVVNKPYRLGALTLEIKKKLREG